MAQKIKVIEKVIEIEKPKVSKETLKLELDYYLRGAQVYSFTLFAFIVIYVALLNFVKVSIQEYSLVFVTFFIFSMCLGIAMTVAHFYKAKKTLEILRSFG
jgi:hypothetical protein